MILRLTVMCALLALSSSSAGGQLANEARAPATPTDFDFLEGEWDVVYNNSQAGIPPDVRGTWIAQKQADGRVLYDEFRLFGANGETVVLGATYRVFDHTRQQWDMRYVGLLLPAQDGALSRPAQWAELTAWREGAGIRVDQRSERSWLRITYYNIESDHFSWRADVSTDRGNTWHMDQIRIEAKRRGAQ